MRSEINGWVLIIKLSNAISRNNRAAESIRKDYHTNVISKVEAVKEIRDLFLGTNDERQTLKGALDYVTWRKI